MTIYKTKLREIIAKILASEIHVDDVCATQNSTGYTGYIEFSVNINSLGVSNYDFVNYRKEIFSNIFIDFFTELTIKENYNLFLDAISCVNLDEFNDLIGGRKHDSAGLCIKEDKVVFTFHISYLQQLFVSDFKKRIC